MEPSPGLVRSMAWITKRSEKSQFTDHDLSIMPFPGVVERGSVEKHSMVLWSCFVCGQRHQINAEFRKDKVQEDLHRQAVKLHHLGDSHLPAQYVPLLHSCLRVLGEHDWF